MPVIYVGDTDPNFRARQLRNWTTAIQGAFQQVEAAKERKERGLIRKYELAMKTSEDNPAGGAAIIDAIQRKYKPEYIEDVLGDLEPVKAMFSATAIPFSGQQSARERFITNLNVKNFEFQGLSNAVQQIPQTLPMQDPIRFAMGETEMPNPIYQDYMQRLQEIGDPDQMGRTAMDEMSAYDQLMLKQLEVKGGFDLAEIYEKTKIESLSPTMQGLAGIKTGQITGDMATAQRSAAGLEQSPATIAAQEYRRKTAELKADVDRDLVTFKTDEKMRGAGDMTEAGLAQFKSGLTMEEKTHAVQEQMRERGPGPEGGPGGMTQAGLSEFQEDLTREGRGLIDDRGMTQTEYQAELQRQKAEGRGLIGDDEPRGMTQAELKSHEAKLKADAAAAKATTTAKGKGPVAELLKQFTTQKVPYSQTVQGAFEKEWASAKAEGLSDSQIEKIQLGMLESYRAFYRSNQENEQAAYLATMDEWFPQEE